MLSVSGPVILCVGVCPGHCGQLASAQASFSLSRWGHFRRNTRNLNMGTSSLFKVILGGRSLEEGVDFGCAVVVKHWRALLWEGGTLDSWRCRRTVGKPLCASQCQHISTALQI